MRVGSAPADLALGEFVVCDQFVDRTSGRRDTFYEGPVTTHVSAADPYCPDLRSILVDTARELGIPVRDAAPSSSSKGRGSRHARSRRRSSGWAGT